MDVFATVVITPPSAPAGVTATQAADYSQKITVSWTAAQPGTNAITGYNVYRDGAKLAGPITGTSYADTTVSSGSSYQYTVKAIDSTGMESASSAAATGYVTPPPPPGVPGNVTATQAEDYAAKVSVSWTAAQPGANPVTGYNVYRDGAKLAGPITGTSLQDETVSLGYAYQYTVRAIDSTGAESVDSTAASVSVTPPPPPGVPGGLTVAQDGTTVNITWQPPTGTITGYNVYRDGTKIAGPITGTSYADTGTQRGNQYTYKVSAINGSGVESAQSAGVLIDVVAPPPPPPPPGSLPDAIIKGSWGFTASDVWTNTVTVIASLGVFILLGVIVHFAPRIIEAIRAAILRRRGGY